MKLKALLLTLPLVLLALLILHQTSRDGAPEPPAVPAKAVPREQAPALPSPRMDWSEAAAAMSGAAPSGRIDENSGYGRLLKEVETMTGPQLVAAWEQLAEADLPAEARLRFEMLVLGTLVRKDVELALIRFADQIGNPATQAGTLLLSGFREWASKFPMKADLWLDARIQDGTLKGGIEVNGSPVRVLYERELIRSLLIASPDKAAARLEALPVSWRSMALSGTDSMQSQGAYATLVRKHFPEAEWMAEFSRMAVAARYLEGPEGVERLLKQIAATPAERERILREASAGPGDNSPRTD